MKNRAKCKLCQSVIESFHQYDLVSCKCGEISISGGNYTLDCWAKDFDNFLRVDDQDNEIIPTIIDKDIDLKKAKELANENNVPILSYGDKVEALLSMIKNIEGLPQQAMTTSVNHYDFLSLMLLIYSILKDKDKQ